MYEKYWELKEKPFKNTPDPRFLYHSPMHEEALLKLTYAVAEGMGAALLSGVFGCGKTLLGQAILNDLGAEKYRMAFINHPPSTSAEIIRAIVRNLKATNLPEKMNELMTDSLLEILQEILIANMQAGLETVVLIDEAHAITDDRIFDSLRMLLNFQLQNKFLLTLLLVGQPEIRQKVSNLKQLEQRIAIRCHLDHFKEDETASYIVHRLKVAGCEKEIFTPDALQKIHEFSTGIPRKINHFCDLSLLTGMGKKTKSIDASLIIQSGKEFGSA
ncbi:MAG: AAA family ATPase [Candidatus Aureabacteria bacterium]|nr:AAA family ATPase [Candidatus Auribacterota bacterium]